MLGYVVDVLASIGEDGSFNMEDFMEMLSAYIPGFSSIDR